MCVVHGTCLVVGGSHSEIPVIDAAKRMGMRVVTTGNRPNDLGHQYADQYVPCDYSQPDQLLRVARDVRPVALVSGANDFAALSASRVAEKLGLPGHDSPDVAELLHHKDKFRAFSMAEGFPVPRAIAASDVGEVKAAFRELGAEALVKPVDMTGGKGIARVTDVSQVEAAASAALRTSRSGRVVVEEFVEGSRHGCTSVIVGGSVRFTFIDDEHYGHNPYLVAAASAPSSVPDSVVDTLRSMIERYASTLRLVDGVFHVQFVVTVGGPVVIEVCRRPPGDLYPWLVDMATGAQYSTWLVAAARPEMGIADIHEAAVVRHIARLCVMSTTEGRLGAVVRCFGESPLVRRELMWWKEGDVITDHLTQKVGIVFLEFAHEQEMRKATADIGSLYRTIVDVSQDVTEPAS